MSYGYLGDTSTKIKQVKKNDGLISASEAFDLQSKGHLGDSYNLITSGNADNSSQTLEFDDCFNDGYTLYLIQWKNFVPANDENMLYFRFKNASGEVTSGYEYAGFYNTATGGSGEDKSTSATYLRIMGGGGSSTGENANGHIYVYAPNGSERTFVSYSSSYVDQNALYQNIMGGGCNDTAEATPSCMFRCISSGGTLGNINTLNVSIYGVKEL